MGLEDRDDAKDAHRQRDRQAQLDRAPMAASGRTFPVFLKSLLIWLAVMGAMYFAVDRFWTRPKAVVSASGELRIPRALDGHFYVTGTVNGRPVEFLVDTGASNVVVSEDVARKAALQAGTPTDFQTANGRLRGRLVPGVPVTAGPLSVSGLTIGVGLVGDRSGTALLGQNFLAKFNVSISQDEMAIRPR